MNVFWDVAQTEVPQVDEPTPTRVLDLIQIVYLGVVKSLPPVKAMVNRAHGPQDGTRRGGDG